MCIGVVRVTQCGIYAVAVWYMYIGVVCVTQCGTHEVEVWSHVHWGGMCYSSVVYMQLQCGMCTAVCYTCRSSVIHAHWSSMSTAVWYTCSSSLVHVHWGGMCTAV